MLYRATFYNKHNEIKSLEKLTHITLDLETLGSHLIEPSITSSLQFVKRYQKQGKHFKAYKFGTQSHLRGGNGETGLIIAGSQRMIH